MRTFLIVLGIWLLINVLFVVIMMPPRKPRKPDHPRSSAGLAPAAIERNAHPFDEEEKVSLRHTIIAIAMGALFSLTPPLLEAIDDIKRLVRKSRKSGQPSEAEDGEGSLETVSEDLRTREEPKTTGGSSSDDSNAPKR
ncbi:phosphonate metabolism protein PhnM [Bradyrhizobium iriomotense]|uniref:phosphonate metabolism protein PhnM n=1 Tax=Bradyrhizobium iriomotense TaxID=441950 RepID=UPI001B89FF5D|nr:phosphonate metabolism protein PhnM [Bradyrhizobium iriomotense]MBR1128972.1 phosphonate metabolism protein PhnM [Bradyrhizobium iriomotense]